ncbi:MAG: ATP-binding protein [Anaerolineae bacterium]|jgi:two-component system NtrC family sensor kinase
MMVASEVAEREQPRILIVDDDPEMLDLMKAMLGRVKSVAESVVVAYSGEEALETLRRQRRAGQPIDLVLLDIMMPGMDGYEVIARAKADPDLRRTSFIVTTALDSVSNKTLGLGMGADDYLTKPIHPRELLARIDAVMRIRRSERELRRRNQELAALVDINRIVTSSLDLDEVLESTMEGIREIMQVEAGSLVLLDEESGQLTYRKMLSPVHGWVAGRPVEPDQGLAGHVIASGEAKLVNDVERDPHFSGEPGAEMGGVVPEAVLCVPLMVRESRIGAIELINKLDGPFDEQDLALLKAMAASVAVAVENANLYAEIADFARELERSQAKLVQAEKMAAIGRLTASLAHEVNNPLQAIHNSLHMSLHEGLTQQRREQYLEMAQSEVERLIEIVLRMLDFYRPSRGGVDAANVNTVVEDVLTLARKRFQHGDIRVHTDLAPDLPEVAIVADQISQVLLNLVINAVEALPAGGDVWVKTELSDQADEVLLSVRDNGPGMPSEQMTHLFEPFYTTKSEGTGLGLAISYGIVERHGGKIEVSSHPDQGTTFVVRLPAEPEGSDVSSRGGL